MSEEELLELGRQVEAFRRSLRRHGDESHAAWLAYREMRCMFLSLAAMAAGTPEAHAVAEEARRSVLDFEAAGAALV